MQPFSKAIYLVGVCLLVISMVTPAISTGFHIDSQTDVYRTIWGWAAYYVSWILGSVAFAQFFVKGVADGAELGIALGFIANLLSLMFAFGRFVTRHHRRTLRFLTCWVILMILASIAAVSSIPLMIDDGERVSISTGFVLWCGSFVFLCLGLVRERFELLSTKQSDG